MMGVFIQEAVLISLEGEIKWETKGGNLKW
jgi:hypothetical protein